MKFLIRGTGSQLEINLSTGIWPSKWAPLNNEHPTRKRGHRGLDTWTGNVKSYKETICGPLEKQDYFPTLSSDEAVWSPWSFPSFFFFWSRGMWDLSSPTRDRIHTSCSGSTESQQLDHLGSPPFSIILYLKRSCCFSKVVRINLSWIDIIPNSIAIVKGTIFNSREISYEGLESNSWLWYN